MDMEKINKTVIKTGICIYGLIQYRVFICNSSFFPGTGDYEDEEGICYDREITCFCIYFEDILNKENINSAAGYYETLHKAIQAVEESAGFAYWID